MISAFETLVPFFCTKNTIELASVAGSSIGQRIEEEPARKP
jgi:hypothetical protein